MMVIYLPVKFEFDWTQRFRVKSPETEMLTDKWTKNRQTNIGITPISNLHATRLKSKTRALG